MNIKASKWVGGGVVGWWVVGGFIGWVSNGVKWGTQHIFN